MTQNIKKIFDEQGFVKIKGVLDYKLDLEPILNDMNFIMNRLVYRFVAKKNKKKVLDYDFKKKYSYLVKLNIPELDQYFNIRLPQHNISVDSDFFASQSIFTFYNKARQRFPACVLATFIISQIHTYPKIF